jgi:hypothetical protein
MKRKGSLACSQQLDKGSYSEPNNSTPRHSIINTHFNIIIH